MSPLLPPDLRVLTRKLTSVPPEQLAHSLPSLTRHVLRCQDALSAPQDLKLKGDSSQAPMLVHKLKTSISTFLNGRSHEGRFVAIGLIKAAVDVGGWETLRGSEPWARGLLSIVQEDDPAASKELAVVTLARIYMLVHPYQTLVREVATPTLPTFATACLQLIKSRAPGQALTTSLHLIETICDAFSSLIPLYPPTFRPFSSSIRSAVRYYLAPTLSDQSTTHLSLHRAARRLVVSLHFVAAKSGGGDEWTKVVDGILKEFHSTADQVFRAIEESWGATSSQSRPNVDADGEPHGGGTSVDQFPSWSGLSAGSERLIGLFHYLADLLGCPTKAAVTLPISSFIDIVSRVCMIARLSKSQTWEQSVETNPAIGREEREDLWSLIPDIHVASMKLIIALFQRLTRNMLPLVPEVLDHLVRVFKSGISIPAVRMTGYTVLNAILNLAGPTLSKPAVDMLDPLVGACCRDLQQDAGFLKPAKNPSAAPSKDAKRNGAAAVNTDLFLQPQAAAVVTEAPSLEADHRTAAAKLLTTTLSRLPPSLLKPTLRALLDKTAILTRNRDAMLSSVLNPYKDQRGRMYPSILPHLSQQFPHDQGLEVLRSNLRTGSAPGSEGDMFASVGEIAELEQIEEEEDEQEDEAMQDHDGKESTTETVEKPSKKAGTLPTAPQVKVNLPIQSNPFEPSTSNKRASSPPKRKHEDPDPVEPKRQELENQEPVRVSAPKADDLSSAAAVVDDNSDDDGESVHLNMELDDDDSDDDDDDDYDKE